MTQGIRKHATTAAIAMVTALVTAGAAPAIAHGVHALFAHNSDKVDGLHAVKSNVSKKKRKGKLVATSRKTGRLPNNIIRRHRTRTSSTASTPVVSCRPAIPSTPTPSTGWRPTLSSRPRIPSTPIPSTVLPRARL